VIASLREEEWVTGAAETAPQCLRVNVRSLAEAERSLPAALARSGARVVSLAPEVADLEDVFLELTR
jgi:hypothetical protein